MTDELRAIVDEASRDRNDRTKLLLDADGRWRTLGEPFADRLPALV